MPYNLLGHQKTISKFEKFHFHILWHHMKITIHHGDCSFPSLKITYSLRFGISSHMEKFMQFQQICDCFGKN